VKGEAVLRSSAVMAAGTIVSRITGLGRSVLIAATLGLSTAAADMFMIPNTIPTALYILVAGGVLNSVLVPQLVRALRNDEDGGIAYAQRVFTAVTLLLLVATVAATVTAPWLLRLYVNDRWLAPELSQQFDMMVMFARFSLPQIFFFGLYVLLGQILNARGSFGPMMWAPVLNNIVAISVFGGFLLVNGPHAGSTFTPSEIRWLGLGATFGIVVQALVLVPVVWRTGMRLRLRFDLRGAGLGKVGRLGIWTTLFVVVNQLAYLVVVNLASGASAEVASGGASEGAGYSVYSTAFLLLMVPHAVITVSLATALLPRMSAQAGAGEWRAVGEGLGNTIRTCLAVIAPVALTLVFAAGPLVMGLFNAGAATGGTQQTSVTLVLFLPGLVAFTVHYLVLRGFYSYEDTRTPFFIQIVLAVTNVTVALVLVAVLPDEDTAYGLGTAWSAAYVVGAIVSFAVLRMRHLPSLRIGLGSLALKLGIAGVATGVWCFAARALLELVLPDTNIGQLVVAIGIVAVGLIVYLGMTIVVGVREVTDVMALVWKRLSRTPSDGRHARGGVGVSAGTPSITGQPEEL